MGPHDCDFTRESVEGDPSELGRNQLEPGMPCCGHAATSHTKAVEKAMRASEVSDTRPKRPAVGVTHDEERMAVDLSLSQNLWNNVAYDGVTHRIYFVSDAGASARCG